MKSYTFRYNNTIYMIPKGFVWDGATIPRTLWTITGIDPFGWVNAASLIHDYIYIAEGKMPDGAYISRKEADELFVKMLLELKLINTNFVGLYKQILRIAGLYFWTEKY